MVDTTACVADGTVYTVVVEAADGSICPRTLYVVAIYAPISKKKEKDGTEVIGNIIKAKTAKSRLSKENQDVEVRLYYDERGLDRYYGLLELGEQAGMWKNVAGRYEINGKKLYAKEILKNPDQYFTEEVMQQLDAAAKQEFSYGTN